MKCKEVFGALGAVLILGLLVASFTMILPLQDSTALGVHDCLVIRWEPERDADGNVIGVRAVIVGGFTRVHPGADHRDDHEFTCW